MAARSAHLALPLCVRSRFRDGPNEALDLAAICFPSSVGIAFDNVFNFSAC
jgi:hypothetical protein